MNEGKVMKKRTPTMTYAQQLLDPRWQKKRLMVLNRADFACENCGDKTKTLEIHHLIYRSGAMAWEYDEDELQCLCSDCHHLEYDNHRVCRELSDEIRTLLDGMCLASLERVFSFVEKLPKTRADWDRIADEAEAEWERQQAAL